jgi:hypothetical protein
MLLGLYPPGKNNYKITEEQKYNAVPPVEGFDFKPWIDEMGLEALPYQTTVFPIQMNGWSYDYMLALDDDNCPTRAAQRKTVHDQVETNVKAIATAEMPEIQQYFDKYGWSEFCNTVNWAYTESIELTIPQDIEKMQSTCNSARKNETLTYYTLDKGDSLKGVTTNELRKNLKAQIDSWVQPQAAVGQSTAQKTLEGTAGSEHPKYVMLWTNERLLSQIALSMSSNKDFEAMLPLGPSATIVLEFTQASPTDDL